TSNSVWFNIPISILLISVLRYFSLELELRWRMDPIHQESYHSHLKIRQLSHSDPLLLSPPISKKWKRTIDSPVVAAAVDKFTQKIVQEFITDLWYSSVTPDREFPDQIRLLINDVLGEVAQRLKHINLIELLTRDVVDLIGSHIELYRRNEAYIGVDVMATLSSNERDERLKHYLASSKELHPALISSDTECKVLQQLMGGVVAVVLRPRDAQCPIVRCLARELLACVVMQPIMDLAIPMFINELIEFLVFSAKEEAQNKTTSKDETEKVSKAKFTREQPQESSSKDIPDFGTDSVDLSGRVYLKDRHAAQIDNYRQRGLGFYHNDRLLDDQIELVHDPKSRSGDLAQLVEAKAKRTQVPAPEKPDNIWAKGQNYKQKESSKGQYGSGSLVKLSVQQKDSEGKLKQDCVVKENDSIQQANRGRSTAENAFHTEGDTKWIDRGKQGSICGILQSSDRTEYQDINHSKQALHINCRPGLESRNGKQEESRVPETQILKVRHRRSKSSGTESEQWQKFEKSHLSEDRESSFSKNIQSSRGGEVHDIFHSDNQSAPLRPQIGNIFVRKLDCWVLGVHFEKVGMKSIAVYSIAVTNSENKTWFVDRRYRNFEQLHRHLRDIPNYKLHIPPKSFISSNHDDFLIRQRCILLDKYLKDLLSIPNIAEQHEVWDFLSATSKNYSFGKTPSVMETLAYNMDDAMVDIVRQFKGVSSGLRHSIVGTSSAENHLMDFPWKSETADMKDTNCDRTNRSRYLSDEEELVRKGGHETHFLARTDGWLSDSELHEEYFTSQSNAIPGGNSADSIVERIRQSQKSLEAIGLDDYYNAESLTGSDMIDDAVGVPPEWTPTELSIPLLNLVDKVFQLHQRGWLRRQVLWIGKQFLHLVMGDAINDWLLRQIQVLKREDVIASCIRQVQEVLSDKGIFTSEVGIQQQKVNERDFISGDKVVHGKTIQTNTNPSISFQHQQEAARRAKLVRDVLVEGAPAPLVSIIGRKQYNRSAKDIYFFLQ
ncbi:hypothetical protein KI387_026285, partial [Taxus chinensis]